MDTYTQAVIPRVTTASRGIEPIVRVLSAFPIACFTCAFCTDIAYWQSANTMWVNFSDWLLAAGMAGGVLALIAGLVGWVADRRRRALARTWPIVLGSVVTLGLALVNNFVHSRDAWTSVVPEGLVLSALTVIVMLATAWLAFGSNLRRDVVRSGVVT